MTWVRLDDGFFRHPKAHAAGKDGRALFLAGLCWSAANLTDGRVPKASVRAIAAEAEVKAVSDKLVDAGLWKDHGDHYMIHGFLERNRSRDQVEAEREASAERQRKARDVKASKSRKRHAVTDAEQEPKSRPRHGSGHTANDPLSNENPTGSLAAQVDAPARRVARTHWEATDPKPTLSGSFIALVKLCERFLDSGWSEDELLVGLARTRSYTLDSISFVLNEGRDKSKGLSEPKSFQSVRAALLSGEAS